MTIKIPKCNRELCEWQLIDCCVCPHLVIKNKECQSYQVRDYK